jgi:hypothetical protein
MRKFIITETRPVEAVWTYEVEAENEQEAMEMIYTGQAEATNHEIQDMDKEDSQFDVIEIEDDTDGIVSGQYLVTIDKK